MTMLYPENLECGYDKMSKVVYIDKYKKAKKRDEVKVGAIIPDVKAVSVMIMSRGIDVVAYRELDVLSVAYRVLDIIDSDGEE